MGIYIYIKNERVSHSDDMDDNSVTISERIPTMLGVGEKLSYRFDGYWRDVGTIVSLWDSNMDMLSADL